MERSVTFGSDVYRKTVVYRKTLVSIAIPSFQASPNMGGA
jgi:hypothetical protein